MNYQQLIFEAAASGSVEALQEVVNSCGLEQTAEYAKSQNEERETPLIVAVKGEHYEVVEFLVDELHVSVGQTGRFLWNGVDYLQVPPLFAVIICGKLPYHPIIELLIAKDVANPVVLESILSSSIPRSLKIDILELIGAAYALNENRRRIAMDFWVHATTLRQSTATEPAIPKLPYNLSGRDLKIFGQPFEFSTVEQLYELPNQTYYDPIQTEALITLRRITSKFDPKPNAFFLFGLYIYGEVKYWQREYGRLIDVVMLVLEQFEVRRWEDVIHFWTFCLVRNVFHAMARCIQNIFLLPQSDPDRQELFANIMKGLSCASNFAAKIKTNINLYPKITRMEWIGKVNSIIFEMVFFLSKMLRYLKLNYEESQQLKLWLYKYVNFDYTDNGSGETLLHWTCSRPNIPVDLVRLLLEVKANHNALDWYGQTPLHSVATNWDSRDNVVEAAELLMDAGCHLIQPDKDGATSLQLFRRMHDRLTAEGLLDTAPNLENLIHNVVLPLTCYCAQTIRKQKIPFKNLIPPVVESFVEKHGELPN